MTPRKLEKRKHFFEHAPLVDIGGEFNFYHDHLTQLEGRRSSGDMRDSTPILSIGYMVPKSGGVGLVHNLRTQVGIYMNHPFDWKFARLTVSCLPYSNSKSITLQVVIFPTTYSFLDGLADISNQIETRDMYSLEFETIGCSRLLSVRFWKDDVLGASRCIGVFWILEFPGTHLAGASRLPSVNSAKPVLVSVSVFPSSVV